MIRQRLQMAWEFLIGIPPDVASYWQWQFHATHAYGPCRGYFAPYMVEELFKLENDPKYRAEVKKIWAQSGNQALQQIYMLEGLVRIDRERETHVAREIKRQEKEHAKV